MLRLALNRSFDQRKLSGGEIWLPFPENPDTLFRCLLPVFSGKIWRELSGRPLPDASVPLALAGAPVLPPETALGADRGEARTSDVDDIVADFDASVSETGFHDVPGLRDSFVETLSMALDRDPGALGTPFARMSPETKGRLGILWFEPKDSLSLFHGFVLGNQSVVESSDPARTAVLRSLPIVESWLDGSGRPPIISRLAIPFGGILWSRAEKNYRSVEIPLVFGAILSGVPRFLEHRTLDELPDPEKEAVLLLDQAAGRAASMVPSVFRDHPCLDSLRSWAEGVDMERTIPAPARRSYGPSV